MAADAQVVLAEESTVVTMAAPTAEDMEAISAVDRVAAVEGKEEWAATEECKAAEAKYTAKMQTLPAAPRAAQSVTRRKTLNLTVSELFVQQQTAA